MIHSTTTIHDVDRVSIKDAHGLDMPDNRITYARTITIRSGQAVFKITLFATDPRFLAVHEEG